MAKEALLPSELSFEYTCTYVIPKDVNKTYFSPQITDIITTYGETGLPDCTYCAAVPNNIDRNLAELLEDIHADQSEMERRARDGAGAATSACSLEPEEEEPKGIFAAAKKFFKL